jgi:DNA-binding transcriptional LysR family regulator
MGDTSNMPKLGENFAFFIMYSYRYFFCTFSPTELGSLLEGGKTDIISDWLKRQVWYSTAADMENHKNFWLRNFGHHPDFKPNYIVPNISSIIRCLSRGKGFSIIPDFLCRDAIDDGVIKLIWEGNIPLENTLYFGTRKKTIYAKELNTLQQIFMEKWQSK